MYQRGFMYIAPQTYKMLLRAAQVSPSLQAEMIRLGPLEIQLRPYNSAIEHLYRTILQQQISRRTAEAIWGRIEAFAASRSIQFADLFDTKYQREVMACGVSGFKFRALCALRHANRSGLLIEDELASMSHERRSERLTAIWGVGQWTSDMLGIFHFLEPDIWPTGDATATGMLRHLTGHSDITMVSRSFRPYRSLLAKYMWRLKDKT